MVTRNSVTWSFSTTTLSSAIQAPLIPWTVSAAFAIPVFAASAKHVGDEAVISITLATLMAASSVGDCPDSRTPAATRASAAVAHPVICLLRRVAEELVDRGRDDDLEPRPSASDRLPGARRPDARTEVEGAARGVRLLDEQHDRLGATAARPCRNGANQDACDASAACFRVDPQRHELRFGGVETAEASDDAEQPTVLLGDEQHFLLAGGGLCRPALPDLVRLPDGVLVARREVRGLLAQHAQPRLAPEAPFVAPYPADLDAARLTDARRRRPSVPALAGESLAA